MKRYTLTRAESLEHIPEYPDRTAHKRASAGILDFDRTYQVWTNRPALARTIRMQEKRERRQDDWSPCVKLGLGEGH